MLNHISGLFNFVCLNLLHQECQLCIHQVWYDICFPKHNWKSYGPNRSPGVWSQRHFRHVTTWQKQRPFQLQISFAMLYQILNFNLLVCSLTSRWLTLPLVLSPALEGLVASHLDSIWCNHSRQFMISGSKAASSRTLPSKNNTAEGPPASALHTSCMCTVGTPHHLSPTKKDKQLQPRKHKNTLQMNILPNLKPDHRYKDRRYKQSTRSPAPNTGINELSITIAMEKLPPAWRKKRSRSVQCRQNDVCRK